MKRREKKAEKEEEKNYPKERKKKNTSKLSSSDLDGQSLRDEPKLKVHVVDAGARAEGVESHPHVRATERIGKRQPHQESVTRKHLRAVLRQERNQQAAIEAQWGRVDEHAMLPLPLPLPLLLCLRPILGLADHGRLRAEFKEKQQLLPGHKIKIERIAAKRLLQGNQRGSVPVGCCCCCCGLTLVCAARIVHQQETQAAGNLPKLGFGHRQHDPVARTCAPRVLQKLQQPLRPLPGGTC